MILVDASVWIELLGGRLQPPTADQLSLLVTCGPIVQEMLQGSRSGSASETFRDRFLALPCISDPLVGGLLDRSDRHRQRRGDRHRDRETDAIARYTPLRQLQRQRCFCGGM